MPTPPPKTGAANWTAQHHRLSEGTRQELISLLGLDPSAEPKDIEIANHALAEVEKWLGFYPGAENTLKGTPKASDFVRSLSSIEIDTLELLRNLKDSHQWIRDELIRTPIDLDKLYVELEKLLDASRSIKGKYEGIESRGAPKKEALRHVILNLREVFAEFNQGSNLARRKIGYVRPLSEAESQEMDFIKFSLDDVPIPYGDDDDLRRLLDEPNVTVKSRRREEIYSEKNVERARDQQLKLLEKKKKKERK